MAAWFRVAWRRLRGLEGEARLVVLAAMASVAALLGASLVDFPLHRAETWALLWLTMAVPLTGAGAAASMQRQVSWLRYGLAVGVAAIGILAAARPLAASYELARGDAEEKAGEMAAAERTYRAVLGWEPAQADAHFNLVRVLAEKGDEAGALEQSGRFAEYVNEPEFYLLRSRILANAGRDKEARQEAEQALRRFPYSAALCEEAAEAAQAEGAAASR
ncbi:MAG: hypothetical protein P4L03_10355 [Terracidiphilus sp.]|nr:hypothetical protein [Terracidiphilus sp.]